MVLVRFNVEKETDSEREIAMLKAEGFTELKTMTADYASMKKADLVKAASARGVEDASTKTRRELITILEG